MTNILKPFYLQNLSKVPLVYSSLVVPTIRLNEISDFLLAWESLECFPEDVHIVYDGHSSGFKDFSELLDLINIKKYRLHFHSWDATYIGSSDYNLIDCLPIPIDMFEYAGFSCFSKKDSAIRSYGFLQACSLNAKRKINEYREHVVFTLDDDCRPSKGERGGDFFKSHLSNLFDFNVWSSTVPGVRVRGVPYFTNTTHLHKPFVSMSVGTWEGMPDFDSIQRISNPSLEKAVLPLLHGPVLAHPSVVYPICGMNLAFIDSMLPHALFPPMGMLSNYKRFDDIWFGLFAQAALKLSGDAWCYGYPNLDHLRLSDRMNCLVAEASGIRLNEDVWRGLEWVLSNYSAPPEEAKADAGVMSNYIAEAMMTLTPDESGCSQECCDYFKLWSKAVIDWNKLIMRYV